MIRSSSAGGPLMAESLAGFFNATVDILRATLVQDELGAPIASWAVVPSLVELPAMIAGGDVSVRMKKQEFRTTNAVYEVVYRRVLIKGAYSDIAHEDRARFAGQDWAIISTVIDPTETFTELLCESLEPGDI